MFCRLPMPEVIHCYYDGKGSHDVFVLENLLAQEYENFDDTKDFDEDHMKSLLECLAQLHGTGLAYKVYLKSHVMLQTRVRSQLFAEKCGRIEKKVAG